MLPVSFNRDTAIEFFDGLMNGQPVRPASEPSGWTADEVLQLAGACLILLASYGLGLRDAGSQSRKGKAPQHPEHEEAEMETVMSDVHAAIDFAAQLAQLAHDGGYDTEYEPLVRCLVGAAESWAGASVVSVAGFKGRRTRS
jgi:hypothetical protein